MDIDEEIAQSNDPILHVWAAGATTDFQKRGRAIYELEQRRRGWEEEQAKIRRGFEMEMFNAGQKAEVNRKRFEEAQLNKQIAASRELASEQTEAARSAATAASRTVWATWAAVFAALLSAIGTVIQAWAALHSH
jgi:hypothetical protein